MGSEPSFLRKRLPGVILLLPLAMAAAPSPPPVPQGPYQCADGTRFTVTPDRDPTRVTISVTNGPTEILIREPTGRLGIYSNARLNLYPEKKGYSLGRYKKGSLYTTPCETAPAPVAAPEKQP